MPDLFNPEALDADQLAEVVALATAAMEQKRAEAARKAAEEDAEKRRREAAEAERRRHAESEQAARHPDKEGTRARPTQRGAADVAEEGKRPRKRKADEYEETDHP